MALGLAAAVVARLLPGLAWPLLWSALAAGATVWTGEQGSPLFLTLLGPPVALAVAGRRRSLVACTAASAVALTVGGVLHDLRDPSAYAVTGLQWLLLSLGLGLVTVWGVRLTALPPAPADDYVEVRQLLEQLRNLTRHLPGGLDAASTADALLDRCAPTLGIGRSAVVVKPDHGAFVPLSVRGATRVPWRNPLEGDGPLRRAWDTGDPVVDTRTADTVGRRRGSSLVAVPLLGSDGPFGLVVLERSDDAGFDGDAVATFRELVGEAAGQLETALLFDELKLQVTTEERDRLAREMHDGIAQELASFGYALDDLRVRAGAVDKVLGQDVSKVRTRLTELVSDLRLSITDLKTSMRQDRGLGAALGAYLRAVCSGKNVVLTLQLHETAFRLPGDQEVALFKAAQAFAQEARRDARTRGLVVHLVVDPPSALMSMTCEGGEFDVELGAAGDLLARIGAVVTTSVPDEPPRLTVELRRGPE